MTIEAVRGYVQFCIDEPFRIGIFPLFYVIPELYPGKLPCNPVPECIRIGQESLVRGLVVTQPGIRLVFRTGRITDGTLNQFDIKVFGHTFSYSTLLIMLNIVFIIVETEFDKSRSSVIRGNACILEISIFMESCGIFCTEQWIFY